MTEQQFEAMMQVLEKISDTMNEILCSIDDVWIAVTGDGYEDGDIQHGLHDKLDEVCDRITDAISGANK